MNNLTDKQEVVDFFQASKIDEIELINDLNFLEEAILFILDKDTKHALQVKNLRLRGTAEHALHATHPRRRRRRRRRPDT